MTNLKKNTIYNSVRTLSTILFPLITFPYISRVLLPENVGKITFGNSIVSYFSLMASLGITTYAIRECSSVRDDKKRLSNTASQIFSINVVTTLVAYIALVITLLLYSKLDDYQSIIIVQSLSIVATTLGADWLNSAMEDFRYITIRSLLFQFLSLMLMLIFVRRPEDYLRYAVITLVSSAGANVINIWYRRKYCSIHMIWNVRTGIRWKTHIIPIIYLFVMLLAQTIFGNVDSTMLGLMHGNREVGIYSAASKLSNIVSQLVASLLWVIMPRMAYYFENDDYVQINILLRKVLGFNALVGFPCAVGGMLMAEDIVLVVAGESYIEAADVLRILMLGFIFSLFGGSLLGNAILLPSKQEKYYMIVCLITAVVNVIGNYIFIPKFGAIAAAGTTAACSLLILFLLLLKVDKRIKIQNKSKQILSPIVGCFGIACVCFSFRGIDNLWIRFFASILTSSAVYLIIQIVLKNELIADFFIDIKNRIQNFGEVNGN